MPRLLALYHDVVDEDLGAVVGWRTIAWGLALADGSAVTVPVDGPAAVTLWPSVDDAVTALDAYVDTPDPRPSPHDQAALSAPPVPFRAATTAPPRSVGGTAARTARPDPQERIQGRDGLPGDAATGVGAAGTASERPQT